MNKPELKELLGIEEFQKVLWVKSLPYMSEFLEALE